MVTPIETDSTVKAWFRERVEGEPYWFQRIELAADLITPGWSDPRSEKLPHFGLPPDMTGMRVLDVGCAEGFFSFEAERRGAQQVVAIDSFPDSIRRATLCRDALGSHVTPYLCNVYDLQARTFGTFDLVMFFGVLYHLRHPLLALERLRSVCSGLLLLQTATWEVADEEELPLARFDPFGVESGPEDQRSCDPTVFWRPNARCVIAMLEHTGFERVEITSREPSISIAVRASSPEVSAGVAPDQTTAPWN
jgi:tRNA (mo5U34)-methyltransferase